MGTNLYQSIFESCRIDDKLNNIQISAGWFLLEHPIFHSDIYICQHVTQIYITLFTSSIFSGELLHVSINVTSQTLFSSSHTFYFPFL